jgi:ribose-phosphate pyrophosphokinase
MAHAYGDWLGGAIAIVAKRRVSAEHVESTHLVGDVDGRDCVMVDDLTATAGTLIKAAERLREAGAKRIFAAVSHCCLNETGLAALAASPITELVTTDTVPLQQAKGDTSKLRVLSVSRLLGEAIRRIHEGRSVSSLLRLDSNPEINYI